MRSLRQTAYLPAMRTQLPLLIIVLITLTLTARGQGNGPGVRGARAAGLSNASVALGGEVWAMGNNVAGLSVALPMGPLLPGSTASQPQRAKNGVVGLEAQRFGGRLYNETRLGLGYGYRFGLISLGGRVDVLQVSIEGLGSRRVVLGSLGGQVEVVPGRLTFGAALYNLNQARLASYQDERVPTVLKAGLAFRPT